MTKAEFYVGDSQKHIAVVRQCGAVPRKGEYVSIRKKTYEVTGVTWAVDSADEFDAKLRANVVLRPIE